MASRILKAVATFSVQNSAFLSIHGYPEQGSGQGVFTKAQSVRLQL
jgi:hypothetical protein